jgi:Sec-independent protein translocase protein TatA
MVQYGLGENMSIRVVVFGALLLPWAVTAYGDSISEARDNIPAYNRNYFDQSVKQIRQMETMMANAELQIKRVELDMVRRMIMSPEQRAEMNKIDVSSECAAQSNEFGCTNEFYLKFQKYVAAKEAAFQAEQAKMQARIETNTKKQVDELAGRLMQVNMTPNQDLIYNAVEGMDASPMQLAKPTTINLRSTSTNSEQVIEGGSGSRGPASTRGRRGDNKYKATSAR